MGYQIVKGWPAAGALDEILTVKTGETVTNGQIVQQLAADTGTIVVAVSPAAASPVTHLFCIDVDTVKADNRTCLTGDFILEVDEDGLNGGDASAFDTGDFVSSTAAGLFIVTTTEQPIGTVIGADGVAGGKVRIRWTA